MLWGYLQDNSLKNLFFMYIFQIKTTKITDTKKMIKLDKNKKTNPIYSDRVCLRFK